MATGCQKLGVNLQTVEAVLGHTAGSRAGIVRVYQVHDFADEKRAALEAWGAHVMGLAETSKVAARRERADARDGVGPGWEFVSSHTVDEMWDLIRTLINSRTMGASEAHVRKIIADHEAGKTLSEMDELLLLGYSLWTVRIERAA